MPTLFTVAITGLDDQKRIHFIQEADNVLDALMKFQEKLDELNRRVKEKFPKDAVDEEFAITAVEKTYLTEFSEEWLNDFISNLCIECEEEEA